MNFITRRKLLALLLCTAFAGVVFGGFYGEAHAQSSTALRVDPALLGLPPLKPVETPKRAAKPAPAPAPASQSAAEVTPVEPDVVETQPVGREEVSARSVERSSVSAQTPDINAGDRQVAARDTVQQPESASKPVAPPATSSIRTQTRSVKPENVRHAAVIEPKTRSRSATSTKAGDPGVTALPLLRVDPALLGLPPLESAKEMTAQSTSGAEVTPIWPDVVEAQPDARNRVAGRRRGLSTQASAERRRDHPGAAKKSVASGLSATMAGVTTLPPLRVDPALLGMAPSVADDEVVASDEEMMPPEVASAGIRDEIRETDYPPQTVFLSAYRMQGNIDREFKADGNVVLRRDETVVYSDHMTYWPIDDEIEAVGNVQFEQPDSLVIGEKMRMKLEDQVGYIDQPSYHFRRQPGKANSADGEVAFADQVRQAQATRDWMTGGFATSSFQSEKLKKKAINVYGDADRIDFEGENHVRMTEATYTTCKPDDDSWYFSAADLSLDYDREVGEGTDGKVVFKGTPILYSPWLSFSLNNERKSGFLSPSFGTSSDSGIEFSLPYYWNIAPNMDATIEPYLMSKRGVQLRNEFRYLNRAFGGQYQGKLKAEILPGDKIKDGDNRYSVSLQHTQAAANGFSGTVNYNRVSDDDYLTDLSSNIGGSATTQLLQQAVLNYGGSWWSASANFQQYQTLQPDPDNPVQEPYRLMPQFTFNARKIDFYRTDSSILGQYTSFKRDNQYINNVKVFSAASGDRAVLYPQVALPYVTPGWYVTPKLGVNVRKYSGLDGHAAGTPGSISVTLPIASIDAGMTFERPSHWFGRDYTQTLEPRLYYLNIPYKDQSKIPLFDTGLADFNFAQIFSENQFSSWDRISNANQPMAAVTSRLLEPESGSEIMRGMLGQRFYFSKNKVRLNSTTSTEDTEQNWDKSDFLAAFSGQILPRVYTDLAWQYSPADRETKRYSIGMRYRPEPGKVFNAAYRYNRDVSAPVDQIDISGQWPISGRWYVMGRANYSFRDEGTDLSSGSQGGRLIESIAGLEYNGGCWALRGVFRRVALTQESAKTAFFIQLELNDFARAGSNPLSVLKRNIQGYSPVNMIETDPLYGE